MPKKPVIGITLDRESTGGYASVPWYALRENYCQSLERAGATVIALPATVDAVEDYLEVCDGIVISGGGFDIPPSLFGDNYVHESVTMKTERTDFEVALIQAALEQDKPVLGICGGEQLLAALFGATLYQHIPDDVINAVDHSPSGSLHDPVGLKAAHTIAVEPTSRLFQIVGEATLWVNSSHHQAVKAVSADTLTVNAIASDGVIEGVEAPAYKFCMGVQWHPEYERNEADRKLLRAFVSACHSDQSS